MTTEQCYKDFLNELGKIYEKNEAANISDWVFENVTGQKRHERRVHKNENVSNDNFRRLQKYLSELMTHEPVQYVLSEAWFYKMKFYVNEYVLIPRPETEELVEWITKEVRSTVYGLRNKELEILDIGTGSGCIPISLNSKLRNIQITSIDISGEALKVASKNAEALHAEINFVQLDFLNEKFWDTLTRYDVIVSNPPYIPENEREKLDKNVALFEPAIALFVPDDNPLIFYGKIAEFAQLHLNANGQIYVEIHEHYSKEVKEIFTKNNFKTEIKNDMYGKARMIRASKLWVQL
jgi:release factor glutamine methyltransferase